MEISTKLTLYDFLTMFVCGMLIVFLIWGNHIFPCQGCSCVFKGGNLQTGMWFLISVAAYIIGMVYHTLIEFLFGGPDKICRKCYRRKKGGKKSSIIKKCEKSYEWVKRILIIFVRNNPSEIKQARYKISIPAVLDSGNPDIALISDYYSYYYHLMEKGCLGNIPVLEAQVAFLKDIIPLLLISLIMSICHCPTISFLVSLFASSPCCFSGILLLLFFSSVCLVIKKQRKIYELVWEGGHFVK